jgi:hypothetical protein
MVGGELGQGRLPIVGTDVQRRIIKEFLERA